MASDGKHFESITEEFLAGYEASDGVLSVERDVKLESEFGPRQVDVLMRGRVGPFDVVTVVECRDYEGKIAIPAIDAFESKLRDVGAHKGVMINRKGYSRNARRKAKRSGIGLFTLNDGPERLAAAGVQIPVGVVELSARSIGCQWVMPGLETDISLTPDSVMVVSEHHLAAYVTQVLLSSALPDHAPGDHELVPDDLKPWTVEADGSSMPVEDVVVHYTLDVNYFFGYLSDSEHTIALIDQIGDNSSIRFRPEDLFKYKDRFPRFDSIETFPVPPMLTLTSVPLGAMADQQIEVRRTEPSTGRRAPVLRYSKHRGSWHGGES